MKYILIIIWTIIGFLPMSQAQTMRWIPSDMSLKSSCENITDCEKNIVCYKLEFTPMEDGVLTSYTTGFFTDCQLGDRTIIRNSSCIMNDNSLEFDACGQVGKILINCSGNAGLVESCSVKKEKPIYIHQVCFMVNDKKPILITEDNTTDLTVSIDKIDGKAVSVFPKYLPYLVKSDVCDLLLDSERLKIKKTGDRKALLEWIPFQESGDGTYTVLKSVDGINFSEISQLRDNNFNNSNLKYTYLEDNGLFGNNFYKVIYDNGKKESIETNVVFVYFEDVENPISLYPNPTKDLLNIELDIHHSFKEFLILDNKGNIIFKQKTEDSSSFKINVKHYAPGLYNIKFKSEENEINKRIIVIQ